MVKKHSVGAATKHWVKISLLDVEVYVNTVNAGAFNLAHQLLDHLWINSAPSIIRLGFGTNLKPSWVIRDPLVLRGAHKQQLTEPVEAFITGKFVQVGVMEWVTICVSELSKDLLLAKGVKEGHACVEQGALLIEVAKMRRTDCHKRVKFRP